MLRYRTGSRIIFETGLDSPWTENQQIAGLYAYNLTENSRKILTPVVGFEPELTDRRFKL
jgi:hypothetical protein